MTKLTAALVLVLSATAAGCMVGTDPGTGTGPGPNPGPGSNPTNPGGGDDDPTNPGGGTVTATEFLTTTGAAECTDAFTCKASFPADAGVTFAEAFGASVTACKTTINMYNPPASVEAEITAGKLTFDGAAAASCLAGLTPVAAAGCAAFWMGNGAAPASCDSVFVGKVADGAACKVDLECSGAMSICDTTCQPDTQQAPRKSVANALLHVGVVTTRQ